MSKDGSIWQLFVLCLLALGDTVPKCYFFTIVWDTPGKEKIAKWSPPPASILEGFNEIEGQKPFQNRVRNTICQIDPCLRITFFRLRSLIFDSFWGVGQDPRRLSWKL